MWHGPVERRRLSRRFCRLEDGGNNTMNAAPFLVRTAARDPRQLQWGARYVF
jgi:hypothetical protein